MADPKKLNLGSGLLGRAKKSLMGRKGQIDSQLKKMTTGVTKPQKPNKPKKKPKNSGT